MNQYIVFILLLLALVNEVLSEWTNLDSDWMMRIDGSLKLNQINIPGSHDSGTFGIKNLLGDPTAKTQDKTILGQLQSGVRYLDIRLGWDYFNDITNIIHGDKISFDCNLTLESVFKDCTDFLSFHRNETVIVSLKNEIDCVDWDHHSPNVPQNFPVNCTNSRINQVNGYTSNSKIYFTENRIPILDEVRGRVVILTRESSYNGIHIQMPNNPYDVQYVNKNCVNSHTCLIQDGYQIDIGLFNTYDEYTLRPNGYYLDVSKKWEAVRTLIDAQKGYIQGSIDGQNILALNFMNTVNLPDGIINELLFANYLERLATDLKNELYQYKLVPGIQYGWIVSDFVDEDFARHIYKTNYFYSIDDKCGSEYGRCRNNECCSEYGYCGETGEYCGVNCQPNYGICGYNTSIGLTPNDQCGHVNGYSCHPGYCCSKFGYCGDEEGHCGIGCQSVFGECW